MRAMVSTAHPIASSVGTEILALGGSAFDAAVAVSFALTVVESDQSSALTGDGFGMFRVAETGELRSAAWSSRTPLSPELVTRIDELADPLGPLGMQAPTGLAGVLGVHQALGTMPLGDILAPAIRLAEDGFRVNLPLHTAIANCAGIFSRHPQTARNFLVEGEAPPVGHTIRLPELAGTLRAVAAEGTDLFYRGRMAEEILAFVRDMGGVLTQADLDLAATAPTWATPISTTYRGYTVHAVPPVAGGIPLLATMNVLEGFDLVRISDAERAHLIAEACKLMFIDMDDYFGDPDFIEIPMDKLLSKEYAAGRRSLIQADRVMPWATPGGLWDEEANTTHFNVVDSKGNVAAITQTRTEWGIKRPVGDTGIFLHNGMRLLSADPAHPMYAGKPGMRLQKSMTPVIVEDGDGRPVVVLGAAGVRRITQAIVQVASNILDLGMDPQSAIDAPRLSYANRDQPLTTSPHYAPEVLQRLRELGHDVETGASARVQAIAIDPHTGTLRGGADVHGAAAGLP